ncbi:MAG: hypothetical protein QF632_06015 [Candidatus Woesearchaeota archaeon]|jgi:chromosome segregation ATPase|nr:hypothetical protein [Candidatus Woesearchaeota archaeon]MDP7324288.1 hypothetical protein [Candidatus Woesearchaeota archaeon]MDP7457276.1 hypothetical protein [Candidatus Woesearchaeota archaeon]|tara:strand:- start:113 stop:676 length:564 start_codon:yes stop_codon:yes gene_type:complete
MLLNSKKIDEELGNLTGKVIDANNDIRRLSVEIGKLKSQMSLDTELKKNQEEILKEFKENAESVASLKGEFEKELYNFKLLSANVEKKLLEKFDQQISGEIHDYFEKLRTDIKSFGDLKEKVDSISREITHASQEVSKFVQISEHIKKADFDLTKYAEKLSEMDSEKLELMRKIDNLERLIAKMRRS